MSPLGTQTVATSAASCALLAKSDAFDCSSTSVSAPVLFPTNVSASERPSAPKPRPLAYEF